MWIILALAAALAACNAQQQIGRLAHANNHLGINLFKALPSSPSQNVFFSPYSVSVAMGMAYAGAGGATLKELQQNLGFDVAGLSEDEVLAEYRAQTQAYMTLPAEYILKVANAVLIQKNLTVLPTYKELLRDSFDAEIVDADFVKKGEETKERINNWVSNKTDGKIAQLLDAPFDPATRLVLLNAVYFKGTWKTKFDSQKTKPRPFYNGGTDKVIVDTMRMKAKFNYTFDFALNAHVLELPYIGDDYSFVVFLPLRRKGVERMKLLLTMESYRNAISQLDEREVKLKLPKLKLDLKYSLKNPLISSGIEKIFKSDADLSRIDGTRDLFVSDVLHRAVFQLDEEGSEAAAVTSIEVQLRMAIVPLPTPRVFVDHPFVFLIRNVRTNGIAFLGQVNAF